MHVTQRVVIKGAGFFKGVIEGIEHNTGQVFIEEAFDSTKENYKGFRTVEYKCTDSELVQPIMAGEFPITAEVDLELSATKRGQTIVVKRIKPLEAARPMPKAA